MFCKKFLHSIILFGSTSDMQSKCLSLFPATIPIATAGWIPLNPPVFGTTTALTFLIILLEALIETKIGSSSKYFFAKDAA